MISLRQFEMGVRGGEHHRAVRARLGRPQVDPGAPRPRERRAVVARRAVRREHRGRRRRRRPDRRGARRDRAHRRAAPARSPRHAGPAARRPGDEPDPQRALVRVPRQRLRLVFDHGFASAHLELGGLARLVSIGELSGIPMGPIVDKLLATRSSPRKLRHERAPSETCPSPSGPLASWAPSCRWLRQTARDRHGRSRDGPRAAGLRLVRRPGAEAGPRGDRAAPGAADARAARRRSASARPRSSTSATSRTPTGSTDCSSQHCVGEGSDGLIVDTRDACKGAADADEVQTLVERVNRARRQLWRWMHEQRTDVSADDLRARLARGPRAQRRLRRVDRGRRRKVGRASRAESRRCGRAPWRRWRPLRLGRAGVVPTGRRTDDDLHWPERLTVGVADDLLGQLEPRRQDALLRLEPRTRPTSSSRRTSPTGARKQLFDDGADVTWPRVSPDGKSLLYISFRERASGQLCVRRLPDGDGRRCLDDPSAALQAEWIDARPHRARQPAVDPGRPARPRGDGRVEALGASAARPQPDEPRGLARRPLARVRPGRALRRERRARPSPPTRRSASRRCRWRPPAPAAPVDLAAARTDRPARVRQGRALALRRAVLHRLRTTTASSTRATTACSSACRSRSRRRAGRWALPSSSPRRRGTASTRRPSADRLIATCSQDASLDVYSLPLDGEVPADWTCPAARRRRSTTAGSRVERAAPRQPRARARDDHRRPAARDARAWRMLHLELEEFRAAEYYAERVAELHDHATAGISHPLLALVEQRRAERETGSAVACGERSARRRGSASTSSTRNRRRARWPRPSRTSCGARSSTRSATRRRRGPSSRPYGLDETTPAPVVEAYYQRADALYRSARRSRGARRGVPRSSPSTSALAPRRAAPLRAGGRARHGARAAVWTSRRAPRRASVPARRRRLRARLRDRPGARRARDPRRHAPPAVGDALLALYARRRAPDRRARARRRRRAARADEVDATTSSTRSCSATSTTCRRGTRERGERRGLYRRVILARAYRRAAARAFARRARRLRCDRASRPGRSRRSSGPSTCASRPASDRPTSRPLTTSRARRPRSRASRRPICSPGSCRSSTESDTRRPRRRRSRRSTRRGPELKEERIAQALFGALLHEEYLRTGDLATAEKANVHYLIALELVGDQPALPRDDPRRARAPARPRSETTGSRSATSSIATSCLTPTTRRGWPCSSPRRRALLHVGRDERGRGRGRSRRSR